MFGQTKSPFAAHSSTSAFRQDASTKTVQEKNVAVPIESNGTTPKILGFGGSNNVTSLGNTTITQPAFGGVWQHQSHSGRTLPEIMSVCDSTTESTQFGNSFGRFPPTINVFGQPENLFRPTSKYQPVLDTEYIVDSSIMIPFVKYNCITAMREFENRSLEELRMEHYVTTNRFPPSRIFGESDSKTRVIIAPGLFIATTQPFIGIFDMPFGGAFENQKLFELFGNMAFGKYTASCTGNAISNQFGMMSFGAPSTSGFGQTSSSNPFYFKPPFDHNSTSGFGPKINNSFGMTSFGAPITSGFGGTDTSNSGFGKKVNEPFGTKSLSTTSTTGFGVSADSNTFSNKPILGKTVP